MNVLQKQIEYYMKNAFGCINDLGKQMNIMFIMFYLSNAIEYKQNKSRGNNAPQYFKLQTSFIHQCHPATGK